MTDALIDYLLTEGRSKILEKFEPSSCIASTRIGLEVLRSRGIECYPQPCRIEALNPRAVQATRAGQGYALGTFSLEVEGTGLYDPVGSWDGHLVIVFKDAQGEVLLDLSADQMDRPQHGLRVEPVAVRLGTKGWPVGIMLPGGGAIAWERIPSRAYRQARDWTHRERWEDVVAKILAEAP